MTPPRLARRLVAAAARAADRAFVVGDLDDEFARQVEERGARGARRWYRRQVLTSVVPLLATRARARRRSPGTRLVQSSDWVQAARWLRRRPRPSAAAVLTLALALGAAGAAAVIVHGLVMRPLPFPDESRIVHLWPYDPAAAPRVSRASIPVSSFQDVEDWRNESRTVSALSAYLAESYTFTSGGAARRLDAMRVGRDFETVLGVTPAIGRAFTAGDFVAGSERVALLTAGLWRREFAADPAVVGRTLLLDDKPFEIVGVLPEMPVPFPSTPHEVWVPLIAQPGVFWQNQRGTGWLTAVARVRADVPLPAAREELSAIALALRAKYPDSNEHRAGVLAEPIRESITGDVRPVVLLLAGAIAAVLLVAAGNLVNLLLAQAEERRREFAVRHAIGAAAPRLRAQVLIESLLLVSAGAALGAAAVPLLVRAFVALYPEPLPEAQVALSPAMLPLAAAAVLIVASALALPQILKARSPQIASVLRSARQTSGRGDRRMRALLIAAQVSFSVALLAAGVAFTRTSLALASVDTGFRAEGLLVFSVVPPASRYGGAGQSQAYFDRVLDAIHSIPGVRSAAMGMGVPFVSGGWRFPATPRGGSAADRVSVRVNMTSERFYETLGIPLTRGRLFTAAEQRGSAPIAIINEAAVRLLPDPDRDPIGQRVPYSGTNWEIVGVVGNVRDEGLRRDGAPWFVMPWAGAGRRPQMIAVRTDGDPLDVVPAIRAELARIDPLVPLNRIRRLEDVVRETTAGERFRAVLVAALALVAMLLSALGVYSVTAYAVARGERENGVRLALGESPRALMARVLATSLRPALAGALGGLAVAWALGGAIQRFMHGVEARDPRVLALVVGALVLIAAAAALAPARRAARVNPSIALRAE